MARRKRSIKIELKPLPKDWGQAYEDARVITLDPRMDDHTMLQIAPHEVLHILFPWMTEEAVNEAGIEIGDVLYRLGYRRTEKGDE